uniref:DNA polymerase n=1 Tax=Siphoviridae sp. ctiOl67 TaxID=2825622 RepID=A0A8S5QIX5_9CAUD|nr:MAG TPA: DNA polymerase [Siphoviridae sp. ctiOl67]
MLFRAKEGYKIVGSDYSAQEPRLASQYSHDERMISAYKEGKDLYAVIASAAFNKPYEECLEFYPQGTKIIYEGKEVVCGNKTHQNKEGKSRRSAAKSILLGVLYGRGAASVAEQIGKSYQEAQDIIDQFFKSFPKVK